MFKKKLEIEILIDKNDINYWRRMEQLIKDGWEIKKIENYTIYYTHVTLTK